MNEVSNQGHLKTLDGGFLSLALGNAACFLMLMTALVQTQHLQGARGEPSFWNYPGTAMTALKDHLLNNPNITEEIIYAVSMLTYIDVSLIFTKWDFCSRVGFSA